MLGFTLTDLFNLGVWAILLLVLLAQLIRSIRLVPTRKAYIV